LGALGKPEKGDAKPLNYKGFGPKASNRGKSANKLSQFSQLPPCAVANRPMRGATL
jgi:hypothetical protein